MSLSFYSSIHLSVYLSIYLSVCLFVCLSASLKTKLFSETCLKFGISFKLSSWQYQKRSNSARLPSTMESWVQLTASCQCLLCFSHSTCLKYCTCHEKVRPGHTKCCTCHARHLSKPEDLMLQFFHLSSPQVAPHLPLYRGNFSTPRSHKALEKQGVPRLFYLLRAWVFFLLPFSSLIFFLLSLLSSDSCNLCFSICPYCRTFDSEISFDYILLYLYIVIYIYILLFIYIYYIYIYIIYILYIYYYHHYHNSHSTGNLEGIRWSW